MIEERSYRQDAQSGLEGHNLTVGETDLAIYLPAGLWDERLAAAVRDEIIRCRRDLQAYISEYPDFAASHQPLHLSASAPPVAQKMARAAELAAVGPMAAVAGFFAQLAGNYILQHSTASQVIVENGGDIFIAGAMPRCIGLYAGEKSPFSGKIAVQLEAEIFPCGVCTSSGTFGSSFSYGRADAAMVVAHDAALADAAATMTANVVQSPADVAAACDRAMAVPGVLAALVVCGDQLAAAGALELIPLGQK